MSETNKEETTPVETKADSESKVEEEKPKSENETTPKQEPVIDEEAEKKAELIKKKEASEELTRRLQNLALERQKVCIFSLFEIV
jgi:hypothetical protein